MDISSYPSNVVVNGCLTFPDYAPANQPSNPEPETIIATGGSSSTIYATGYPN